MPGSSGGGKSSSSSSTSSSPFAPYLAAIAGQEWQAAKPTVQLMGSQTAEALRTGGVNAHIPAVNAATDAARQQSSQDTTQLREELARSGLGGSSFAQSILAQNRSSEGQKIADTPSNVTGEFLRGAVPITTGFGQTGLSGFEAAAGADHTTTGTSTPSFMDMFASMFQSGAYGAGAYFGA